MSKGYLICVGVDKYDDPVITQLRSPVEDCIAWKGMCENLWGYETYLLANPSTEKVHAAFYSVADKIKPGDKFIFFFSGHGVSDKKADDQYLLLSTVRTYLLDSGNFAGMPGLLSLRTLFNITNSSKFEGVDLLYTLEACRSLIADKSAEPAKYDGQEVLSRMVASYKERRTHTKRPNNIQIANGCADGQQAYEYEIDGTPRGSFIYACQTVAKKLHGAGQPIIFDQRFIDEVNKKIKDNALRKNLPIEQTAVLTNPNLKFEIFRPEFKADTPVNSFANVNVESMWRAAKAVDNIQSYQEYINKVPANAPHIQDALDRIAEIKAKIEEEKKNQGYLMNRQADLSAIQMLKGSRLATDIQEWQETLSVMLTEYGKDRCSRIIAELKEKELQELERQAYERDTQKISRLRSEQATWSQWQTQLEQMESEKGKQECAEEIRHLQELELRMAYERDMAAVHNVQQSEQKDHLNAWENLHGQMSTDAGKSACQTEIDRIREQQRIEHEHQDKLNKDQEKIAQLTASDHALDIPHWERLAQQMLTEEGKQLCVTNTLKVRDELAEQARRKQQAEREAQQRDLDKISHTRSTTQAHDSQAWQTLLAAMETEAGKKACQEALRVAVERENAIKAHQAAVEQDLKHTQQLQKTDQVHNRAAWEQLKSRMSTEEGQQVCTTEIERIIRLERETAERQAKEKAQIDEDRQKTTQLKKTIADTRHKNTQLHHPDVLGRIKDEQAQWQTLAGSMQSLVGKSECQAEIDTLASAIKAEQLRLEQTQSDEKQIRELRSSANAKNKATWQQLLAQLHTQTAKDTCAQAINAIEQAEREAQERAAAEKAAVERDNVRILGQKNSTLKDSRAEWERLQKLMESPTGKAQCQSEIDRIHTIEQERAKAEAEKAAAEEKRRQAEIAAQKKAQFDAESAQIQALKKATNANDSSAWRNLQQKITDEGLKHQCAQEIERIVQAEQKALEQAELARVKQLAQTLKASTNTAEQTSAQWQSLQAQLQTAAGKAACQTELKAVMKSSGSGGKKWALIGGGVLLAGVLAVMGLGGNSSNSTDTKTATQVTHSATPSQTTAEPKSSAPSASPSAPASPAFDTTQIKANIDQVYNASKGANLDLATVQAAMKSYSKDMGKACQTGASKGSEWEAVVESLVQKNTEIRNEYLGIMLGQLLECRPQGSTKAKEVYGAVLNKFPDAPATMQKYLKDRIKAIDQYQDNSYQH